MEKKQKPPCEFGAKCYRKNPKHFESYSHPDATKLGSNKHGTDKSPIPKKPKLDVIVKGGDSSLGKRQVKMKQTTLQFGRNSEIDSKELLHTESKKNLPQKNKKRGVLTSPRKLNSLRNNVIDKRNHKEVRTADNFQDADDDSSRETSPKKHKKDGHEAEKRNAIEGKEILSDTYEEGSSDSETVKSTSWVFIKKPSTDQETETVLEGLKNKSVEEIIKVLFLVDMPPDFYSFFEFCKSLDSSNPVSALEVCRLKLVGPFDVLSGRLNYSIKKEEALCHWRFYYDPPEFQTVLASNSEFHIGYWRDDPKEASVFLASNDSKKDCIFKVEAENLFGTVFHYMEDFIKTCDPFTKVKVSKLQAALSDWAEKNNYSLDKKSSKIDARKKKVVSKTFHKAGIVVPVEPKTELGYRPLIETEANLKKICKLIMEADDENERESLWENLQPLINAANIANDECDFGNSLELGIDLFCMGSPLFHETVEHLLSTSYSLLGRTQFEEIIHSHLKRRKKGNDLSVFV